MHGAQDFVRALALVLCVAAVTSVLFQRLRQPVVLGYVLAGLIIGPHVPIPLVADGEIVHALSELGVILLMFSLGLEFSFRKLWRVGPTSAATAVIECTFMVWLGFTAARLFGWTSLEGIFTGAIVAVSSTTIIARTFDEQGIRGKLRQVVVGVLVVEDLYAILLMAALTAVASGAGLSTGSLAITVGRLAGFLVGMVAIGLLIVPRTVRTIQRLGRPETTLVANVGICFAGALLAKEFGYSVALGAFLAGSLVAESGDERSVEATVKPVRDLFAAIFFVSVGMAMDPAVIIRHWVPVIVLTVVVIVGKVLGVSLGLFVTGKGARKSIQAAMSLAQIGEFSFIIAGLGISLKATSPVLYPIAVAVSALTMLVTPYFIRNSGNVASWVDRKLPASLQTFTALYATWFERMGASSAGRPSANAGVRRMVRLLFVDAIVLSAIVVGTAVGMKRMSAYVIEQASIGPDVARAVVLTAAAAAAAPFSFGIVRLGGRIGRTLAEMAFPAASASDSIDLAGAPRRALTVTIHLATVVLVGVPIVALTQPFLPGLQGAELLLVIVGVLAIAFWRTTTNLEGHVRAGSEVVLETLANQTRTPDEPRAAAALNALLNGLGTPSTIEIGSASPAAGKTLRELDLRGQTGATVLAIARTGGAVVIPTAEERLKAGDVLAIAGTREAVNAARHVLAASGGSDSTVADAAP